MRTKSHIVPVVVYLLLSIGLLGLALLGWQAVQEARAYERVTQQLIEQLGAEDRLHSSSKQWLETLTGGLYSGYSEQLEQWHSLKTAQEQHRQGADQRLWGFLLLSFLLILTQWWLRRSWAEMAYVLLLISALALAVGLSAPILSISLRADLPVLGETVLQFESKGVLSTLLALQASGNAWLALLLGLFSLVLPACKTLITGLTLFASTHAWSLKGLKLVQHLGKWSMADVFVVAILVAFFAHHEGKLTHTEVQIGLYFFALYVLLSLIATQIIAARFKQPPSLPSSMA
ncbi:MAG: paraquat-inducible protein A [Gammaproteobacteria bacterium]|nr:paraquat-inducible protein A [Gammaproteobacteria bacterium]